MTAPMLPSTPAPPRPSSSASLLRSGLEYQHAFDLCAVEVHRIGGPVALFASSPFYARELLKRLGGCATNLVPIGEWNTWARDLKQWLGPELELSAFQLEPYSSLTRSVQGEGCGEGINAVIWAEPDLQSGKQVLDSICQTLLPEAKLYVISSSWLARFLPEWRGAGGHPGKHLLGLRQVMQWLRHDAFAIEACYGFHGPRSIFWGYVSRLMEHLGRSELVDRCLFMMRATYVVRGWQTFLAPVGVIRAQWRKGIL